MQVMNIGAAAKAAGVSAKMIRHYEEIGLLDKPTRTASGYRTYSPEEVRLVQFIRRARGLGFSMPQVAELLSLRRTKRPSREVKALALAHISALDERIRELVAMKEALTGFATHCHGDEHPECAILDALADPGETAGG